MARGKRPIFGANVHGNGMATGTTVSVALHTLFAALWTGGVIFFAWRVVPLLRDGDIGVDPASALVSGLKTVSRLSAVVLLATGGHLFGVRYAGGAGLLSSTRGYLVVAMVVLWFALMGTVEAGAGRLSGHLDEGRIRTGGRESSTLFRVAAVVAVVVLAIGGYLAA